LVFIPYVEKVHGTKSLKPIHISRNTRVSQKTVWETLPLTVLVFVMATQCVCCDAGTKTWNDILLNVKPPEQLLIWKSHGLRPRRSKSSPFTVYAVSFPQFQLWLPYAGWFSIVRCVAALRFEQNIVLQACLLAVMCQES